jgi:hypothetical protein
VARVDPKANAFISTKQASGTAKTDPFDDGIQCLDVNQRMVGILLVYNPNLSAVVTENLIRAGLGVGMRYVRADA